MQISQKSPEKQLINTGYTHKAGPEMILLTALTLMCVKFKMKYLQARILYILYYVKTIITFN